YADMIGDEIKNEAEVMLPQRSAQARETGSGAKRRIDPGMIDDIIAMAAALAGLHEGRRIEMRDAECLQIGNDRRGGVEIEVSGELQAVGGDRNGWRHQRATRRQHTDNGLTTSPGVPPQLGLPVVSLAWGVTTAFDRFAISSSVAPSPKRQFAVSRPLSAACASPNR